VNTEPPFEDPFDEVIARKLAQIAPPAELRSRLLAERPSGTKVPVPAVEAPGPSRWGWRGAALAAVLTVALVVFGLSSWERDAGGGNSLSAASSYFANFLESDFALGLKTADLPEIREWFVADQADGGFVVPGDLEALEPIGCRELSWDGNRGALICFRLTDGKVAHLIVFPNEAFGTSPGDERVVIRVDGWERSAWSEGGRTYLLFTPPGSPV
jgi:hypothetical protein